MSTGEEYVTDQQREAAQRNIQRQLAAVRESVSRNSNLPLGQKIVATTKRLWEVARSAHAEVLRGTIIPCYSIGLRVMDGELLRARFRRALEGIFQVQFADDTLMWTIKRGPSGYATITFSSPFWIQLQLTRCVQHTAAGPYITVETYCLDGYDEAAWNSYFAEAEGSMAYVTLRDILARCPDEEAVSDMVAAILISADKRPRLSGTIASNDTRRERRIRLKAKDNDDA